MSPSKSESAKRTSGGKRRKGDESVDGEKALQDFLSEDNPGEAIIVPAAGASNLRPKLAAMAALLAEGGQAVAGRACTAVRAAAQAALAVAGKAWPSGRWTRFLTSVLGILVFAVILCGIIDLAQSEGSQVAGVPITGQEHLDRKFRTLAELAVQEGVTKLEASLESRSALKAEALSSRLDDLAHTVKALQERLKKEEGEQQEAHKQLEKLHSLVVSKPAESGVEGGEAASGKALQALEAKFASELAKVRRELHESVQKAVAQTGGSKDAKDVESKIASVTKEVLPALEKSVDERFAKLWAEAERLGTALDPDRIARTLDSASVKAWVGQAVHEVLMSPAELAIALDRAHAKGRRDQLNLTALVMSVVRQQIEVFAADEIGLPDLALYTGGGRIVHGKGWTADSYYPVNRRPLQALPPGAPIHRRVGSLARHYLLTVPLFYLVRARNFVTLSLFGYTQSTYPAEIILQAHHDRGQCWPMRGQSGYVTLRLPEPARLDAFSIQHLDPTVTVSEDTAPKDVHVEALGVAPAAGTQGPIIARHTYVPARGKVQTFYVNSTLDASVRDSMNQFLRLWINSNHGNKQYTCLYRFRVHGKPASSFH